MENRKGQALERWNRTEWFREARFGMFIHWGLYAIPARGEWLRNTESLTVEQYQPYFDEFNPTHYNPVEWAKAAKAAGMKYAVMTAKHHDGFCMFDSKLTDYKSTNTLCKRDLIKEYVEAFRNEGLKVGIYYSLLDWHHEDYPVIGDLRHPLRDKGLPQEVEDAKQWDRYLKYFHGQVEELLTNYGKIDVLWFDFSYEHMTKEKWGASELMKMVRRLQPDVLVDNRLGGDIKDDRDLIAGDFTTPEQIIPPKGVVDHDGNPVPWETCITHNSNWGYHVYDKDYKATKTIIRGLVECVSKNGNMLLNVGPDARGMIPEQSIKMLQEVGEWMKRNSESIYGCGASGLEKPNWGYFTQKGDKVYAHVLEKGMSTFYIENFTAKSARLLRDKSELKLGCPWFAEEFENLFFIEIPGIRLPDEMDTVIELETSY